jgi:hypothetical protein
MANQEDLVSGFQQLKVYAPAGAAPTKWYLTQAAAATLIADSGQTFTRGEKVEYTDPSQGGNIGIVCTTGGIGGVAVFDAFGVIAGPP